VTGTLQTTFGADGGEVSVSAVDAVIGALSVTGGAGDDRIEFSGTKAVVTRDIFFSAGNGTNSLFLASDVLTVGKSSVLERKDRSVTFTGGTGSDDFTITAELTATLGGGVQVNLGAGTNTIGFGGGTIGLGAAAGNSLSYTGAEGSDALSFSSAKFTTSGALDVSAGAGANLLNLSSPTLTIGKGSAGATAGFAVNYAGTGGDDTVKIGESTSTVDLKGAIRMDAGAGSNTLELDGASLKVAAGLPAAFGSSVFYTGGANADVFNLEAKTATLAGAVIFRPGDGANSLTLTGASLSLGKTTAAFTGETNSKEIAKSVLYIAEGAGTDALISDYSSLKTSGSVELVGTAFTGSSLELEIGGDSVNIGKSAALGRSVALLGKSSEASTSGELSINALVASLAGDLQAEGVQNGLTLGVNANRLTVLGAVKVTGGNGSDSVTIDADGSVAKLSSIDLKGVDAIDVAQDFDAADSGVVDVADNEITIVGHGFSTGDAVVYDPGSGGAIVGLTAGTVYYVIAVDDDVLQLAASEEDALAETPVAVDLTSVGTGTQELLATTLPDQSVVLGGKTGLTGAALVGAGLTFKDALTITVDGNANAALSGQKPFQATRSDAVVAGLNALVTESVEITNVSVAKALAATLGESRSQVAIDNLVAKTTFNLDTKGGADEVLIETKSFFGISNITGIASILLGAGDDSVRIGQTGENTKDGVTGLAIRNNQVSFGAALTVNGGDGNDTSNQIGSTNLFKTGITPTLTSVTAS
jgi:hypothetical protein